MPSLSGRRIWFYCSLPRAGPWLLEVQPSRLEMCIKGSYFIGKGQEKGKDINGMDRERALSYHIHSAKIGVSAVKIIFLIFLSFIFSVLENKTALIL